MRRSAFVLLAVALAFVPIAVSATDWGITGKKLLLKNGKFVVLSKSPIILPITSPPVGGADSAIIFNDGSGPVRVALPASLWSVRGLGLYKYKNSDAPGGPSSGKVAKVALGFLKVVGKAAPVAVPNGSASIGVILSLAADADKYCMTFTGTGDGNRFVVKDATAGTCPPQTCGNGVREGTEACDTLDPGDCPSFCLSNCTCLPQTCGNGVREGTEQCDGSDAATCPGGCQANCTCQPPACGNNVREGSEQCDGSDAPTCPGHCQADCTCQANVCGNNVREGTEVCDGTDAAACPGNCRSDCTCPCVDASYPTCGGSCPAGQVCAPLKLTDTILGHTTTECTCLNASATCGGLVNDCSCPGVIGVCAPGTVCAAFGGCTMAFSACSASCGPP